MTRIKICCIANVEEAKAAIECGASALGLVSEMPSGPGVIDEEMICKIAAVIPPGVASFLLTSKQDVGSIIAQQRRCGANTLQIVDKLEEGTHLDIRKALPGVGIVQVVHVTGDESVEEALDLQDKVDAILLDSGNPGKEVKELGGTGRTHNWLVSRKIVEAVDIPVYLAGGLKPSNIAEAVQIVRPFGVDVCSGIRSNGKLDKTMLNQFCAEVRAADFG